MLVEWSRMSWNGKVEVDRVGCVKIRLVFNVSWELVGSEEGGSREPSKVRKRTRLNAILRIETRTSESLRHV